MKTLSWLILLGMLHVQAAWGQELFRTAESSLDEKQRGLVEKFEHAQN